MAFSKWKENVENEKAEQEIQGTSSLAR